MQPDVFEKLVEFIGQSLDQPQLQKLQRLIAFRIRMLKTTDKILGAQGSVFSEYDANFMDTVDD